ncbi:MAG: rhomboid family intramembrane serine protease [Myxococcota bacterium]
MNRNSQVVWDWSGLRPSPVVLGLIVLNVVAFVIEVVLVRLAVLGDGSPLSLVPAEDHGAGVAAVHGGVAPRSHHARPPARQHADATDLRHGAGAEEGSNSVLRAFVLGGLVGSLAQMALGALSLVLVGGFFGGIVAGMWEGTALGASGAVMGVTFAWLARHYYDVMNFLFLGPIRGRTLMLVMVIIELLNMLSLANSGWGAHLGGMVTGTVLGFGWYDLTVLRASCAAEARSAAARSSGAAASSRAARTAEGEAPGPPGDDWCIESMDAGFAVPPSIQ